ncbi:hypothetical protein ACWGQ6_38775, partial [Streptomyces niveus]
ANGHELDLFAKQAISYGPHFHRHPILQALLAQVEQGERYDELAWRIEDAEWQDIRAAASGHAAETKGGLYT